MPLLHCAVMQRPIRRIIRLSDPAHRTVRFLSGLHVSLENGKKESWVTLTRTGSFTDPRYGRFEINREMFLSMIANFEANTYGQSIYIDLNHKPQDGAAGEIKNLAIEGNRLRALVEWTPLGIDAITNRKMVYLSAEYIENFTDNEKGKKHGPLLMGAALTVRPVIKHLDPVQLSEQEGDSPILLHPELLKSLSEEEKKKMEKHLKKLRAKLEAMKLSEEQIVAILNTFKLAAGENPEEAHLGVLLSSFEATGKQLAEAIAANPGAKIELSLPNNDGLTADDVNDAVAKALAERDDKAKKLAETKAAKVKLFSDTINAAEGLSDEVKKELCESGSDLIGDNLTDEQVKRFAEREISQASDKISQASDNAVARQLASMGYSVKGTPHVTPGENNDVKALQEQIDGRIGVKRETLEPFVAKVLSGFDSAHAVQLHNERKMLAGEQTGIADTNLPASYQRTVIREALSDLNLLNLVNAMTELGGGTPSATVGIPYEQRDVSGVHNDGIVYEGQEIHGASISQEMDLAYVNAMKIALNLSNEVMFFTRNNGAINWDAYGRNVQSNARFLRELVCRRIANEMQRSADAYGALDITQEGIDGQLDGATSTIKTAQFPIVRPKQVRDLKGTAVGTAENPIVVRLDGAAIEEYDGTGTQANGTYFRVTSYNLGYIQFVDQAGAAVTPANAAGADDVSYSYATNIVKFDLDNGATDLDLHLNGLLRAFGARKAILSGDRFVNPREMFSLMSPTLNDTITNARNFVASEKKNGTDLDGVGDLERIKGVEAFGTNAPNVDLGDERILLGQAKTTGYKIVKPFEVGAPFEAVGTNGKPTGKKIAYGEEYNAIHTPAPVRGRMTSVIAYSASGR